MNNLQNLINLDLVYNNEWFKKYSNLIKNGSNKKERYYQKHHIVPKSYYKYNKLSIDNTSDNLVYLKLVDHILAHYYLIFCSKQEWFKKSNITAFMNMSNEYDLSIGEKELIFNLSNYEEIYKQYIENQSKKAKLRVGQNSTTGGKISIYNKKLDKLKFINECDLNYYILLGYERSGKPMNDEGRRKIGKSNSISLKGKHLTEDTKKKQSETLRKKWSDPNNNWLKIDRTCSNETKEKHSKSSRDRIDVIKDSNTKRIKLFELLIYIDEGWRIKTTDKRQLSRLQKKCDKLNLDIDIFNLVKEGYSAQWI